MTMSMHWITRDWCLKMRILGTISFPKDHTTANILDKLMDLRMEFGLYPKSSGGRTAQCPDAVRCGRTVRRQQTASQVPSSIDLRVSMVCVRGSKTSNDCLRTPSRPTRSFHEAVERELVRHGADAQGATAGAVTFDTEYERQQCVQQINMLPAYYMQVGCNTTVDCARASTMEPPDFLGHPLHCELPNYLLCCKVLAKRLIGTFSSIPQLT